MTWTTITPTVPGYYWLRNARARFGVYSEPQIVEIVLFMEGDEGDAPSIGPPRVLIFGLLASPPRLSDISGEWCGPIGVPLDAAARCGA